MTSFAIFIMLLKAGAVVLFPLVLSAVLTWADRRQGAMTQDRVGPNRAVVFVPTRWAQAAVVLPAVLAVALFLWWVVASKGVQGPERTRQAAFCSHLAILALWTTALGVAGHVRRFGAHNDLDRAVARVGDPRQFVYYGMGLHAVAALVQVWLRGTSEGRFLREFGVSSGPALLALAVLGGAAYTALVLGRQDRVGVRLVGLLHVVADGIKSAFKEDLIPPKSDRLLHGLAPLIVMFPVLGLLGVVPFGDALCLETENGSIAGIAATVTNESFCSQGVVVPLQVLDLDIGILFYFALGGTGVVGAALAGWSSDNKFSLLGGLRAAGQMVSYEVTLGLTIIGALMIYGTLRIDQMVMWQAENAWGIVVQPVGFVLFFAAAIAEAKRIPFDLPEGESEIVAGYFTEYSGLKFAMFYVSEYVAVVASSGLMAALFFGGWHVPFVDREGLNLVLGDLAVFSAPLSHPVVVAIGVLAFVLKILALCWLQLAVRWTLPRFRYDQLMALGWRKLLPASLGNIAVTAVVVLAIQGAGVQVDRGLRALGDLTELGVAVVGVVLVCWLVRYWLQPAVHQKLEVTSSAKYARAAGGTRTARMGT